MASTASQNRPTCTPAPAACTCAAPAPKKLGFGCMRLPLLDPADQTSVDFSTLNAMVDAFVARGFDYFDTALTYHGFTSEAAMRRALVERHPRDAFRLVSKMPPRELRQDGDIERIFATQLQNCGVTYFDRFLVHNIGASAYAQAERFGMFDHTAKLREQGKIRQLGMSFHDGPELLDRTLTEHPELDFVQLQINYLDWEDPGFQARRCCEVAREHGLPVVAMEPVKGGNLAQLPPAAREVLRSVDPDRSCASWALRFAGGLEGVETVLSGMSTTEVLEDNMGTFDPLVPLGSAELEALDEVARIADSRAAGPGGAGVCERPGAAHAGVALGREGARGRGRARARARGRRGRYFRKNAIVIGGRPARGRLEAARPSPAPARPLTARSAPGARPLCAPPAWRKAAAHGRARCSR